MPKRPPLTPRLLRRPRELVGWILNRPSKRRVKVATSLRFLHEVLGLERLHYGLWDGEPLTLAGLESAQRRYSELLHSWIPDGVRSILDVGAGVGTDALALSRLGYEVEGLSPDPYQQQRFVERTGLPFHLARFQDHRPGRTYDLVLMSESAQYIWIEALCDKVRELAPGGWLLLADYFVDAKTVPDYLKSAHPLPDFRRRAAAAGLRLEREEDVTERVLPTLELAASWLDRYVEPTVDILTDTFEGRRPGLARLARPLLRRALDKGRRKRRELDAEEFARNSRYLVMLWSVAGDGE